jgi:flavodoxin
MTVEIVYCSHKGNTRTLAEAMADALRDDGAEVQVVDVDVAAPTIGPEVELLIVGGPTEGHGMTPEVRDYLARLDAATIVGRPAAAFDTRIDWPRLLSGSAAEGIAHRLTQLGARVIEPAGSFIVSSGPELKPGERERAVAGVREIGRTARPVPA